MIQALDHLTLASDDVTATTAAYRAFLGRPAAREGWFQLGNMALSIEDHGASGHTGLRAITFAATDLDRACGLMERRGLPIRREATAASVTANGLDLRFVQAGPQAPQQPGGNGAITGLDHVVVRSPNPDRVIALFAGRLGLDLRLDRSFTDWGTRLLFFRCGDLVVEVAHDLKAGISDRPDSLWGLSWRAAQLEASHARLSAGGINVSEIRTGRRPGTRVFTVRDPALGVPTLVLGP